MYVRIKEWKVESGDWQESIGAAYSDLVRALAGYGRAVVKYTPGGVTLMDNVKTASTEARSTATAELQLRRVCDEHAGTKKELTIKEFDQAIADNIKSMARIIVTRTKRLKQHARRANERAKKRGGATDSNEVKKWPQELVKAAEDTNNWNTSLFVHIARLVIAQELKAKGLQVEIQDNILRKQDRQSLKSLFTSCADSIGVQKYKTSQ